MARKPTNPPSALNQAIRPRRLRDTFVGPKGDAPASRNELIENHLCAAIQQSVLVELRYGDEVSQRTFAPYVVYRTSTNKVCVFGMQIAEPSHPSDPTDPHNFEVGKIHDVLLTTGKFERDPRFDLTNARYRNRICPT